MASADAGETNDRKLKAEGSHPDAPERKMPEVDMEGAPGWVKQLMKKMDNVEAKVDGMTTSVDSANQAAKEAKELAVEAKKAVGALEAAVGTIQATTVTKDSVAKVVKDAMASEFPALVKRDDKGKGKGHGKSFSAAPAEKMARTVTFGPFPEDTKSTEIKEFIDSVVQPVAEEVEETFAFGRKFAERGGARFRTEEAMWKYMTTNAGNHQHDHKGVKIYCNADPGGSDAGSEAAQKDRAVRKVVRAIIEANGGEGKVVKQNIDARYRKGVVMWKDARVAEWKNGVMEFTAAGMGFKEAFQKLMMGQ